MENIFHAEMARLIRREKEIAQALNQLSDQFSTWRDRVDLAHQKGREELAHQAQQRLDQVRADAAALRDQQQRIATMKKKVRYESRRPSGQEVQRAQALLEDFRHSGLIDPDEATLSQAFETLRQDPTHGESLDDLDLDDLENLVRGTSD